jgi:predicted transcriptional regulator
MRDELRRILTIISDLTLNDTHSSVKDTRIIAEANRPCEEVEKDLNELQSLGLIKEEDSSSKPAADVGYRMYRITREGVKEIYNKEFRSI